MMLGRDVLAAGAEAKSHDLKLPPFSPSAAEYHRTVKRYFTLDRTALSCWDSKNEDGNDEPIDDRIGGIDCRWMWG